MKDFGTLVEDKPKDFGTVVDSDFKDFGTVVESDPTLGQIGTGLVTEIAVGEGSKYAATTAGAAIGTAALGPGFGTAVGAGLGYLTGGISGGISGSIAAQKLEGRDDISWGRVTADTILNILPFGAGKVTKGTKLLPRLVGASVKRGAAGAGLSVGAASIEKGIEEGEFLTSEEFLKTAGIGAGLGLGLGALGGALNKSYSKLLNKNADQIDDLYNKGDVDAITVVDAITGGNPNGRINRMLNSIQQYVIPTNVIGSRASADVREALNRSATAKDIAGRARKAIDKVYNNLDDAEKQLVDKYIIGESTTLPPSAMGLKQTIDESRELINKSQREILELHSKGLLNIDDVLVEKIKSSMNSGDYLTQEYRFYEDFKYVPTDASREALRNSLIKQLKKEGAEDAESQADETILNLFDSRQPNNSLGGIKIIAENSRLFKERGVLTKEMKDFLGVLEQPGEKFFGTLSRLGQLAAQQTGALNITQNLLRSGSAIPASRIPRNMLNDYQKLDVNGQKISLRGEQIYVLKEVNNSLKQLFATNISKETFTLAENAFTKLLSTTTGLSKFVKVPLAPAAYSPQFFGNMFMVLGQGMNPLRGFGKGLRVASAEFGLGKMSLKEFNRYKSLGLVDKEILSSDVRNAFNRGFNILPKTKAGRVAGAFTKKIGKAYSALDTANRISVFENYRNILRSLSPNIEKDIIRKGIKEADLKKLSAKAKKELAEERIDKLAAELTNSTYQNYDRISPSLRYLSRVGVLNEFVSFNLELTRTTFNQARLAKSMIDGSFAKKMADEYGIKIDRTSAMVEGSKRVAFLSAAIGSASLGIAYLNKKSGFSDEEIDAIRNTVAPEWDDSSALLVTRDGDTVGLTNMSYRMPIAELTSMLEAGLGTGSYQEAAGEVFQAFTDKFFGRGTMNATNAIFALTNINPQTGRKISTSVEPLDKVFDQATFYVTKTFEPGLVRDLRNWEKRTGKEQIARYLLGERKMNTEIMKGASFKFRAVNDNVRGIRSGYAGAVSNEDQNTAQAYDKYNANYRQNMQKLIGHINDLRLLGKDNKTIFDALPATLSKQARIMAMRGMVPDMPIASSISGTRLERTKEYAKQFQSLPRELGIRMLEQEVALGRIKKDMLDTIVRVVKLQGQQ